MRLLSEKFLEQGMFPELRDMLMSRAFLAQMTYDEEKMADTHAEMMVLYSKYIVTPKASLEQAIMARDHYLRAGKKEAAEKYSRYAELIQNGSTDPVADLEKLEKKDAR